MVDLALRIENITKTFSKFVALDDLSIDLNEGEIIGLIGPNGSGKTTLINVISGILKPDRGHIKLMGTDISGFSPNKICHHGLNRTFQTPRPITSLTVKENVKLALLYGRWGHVENKDAIIEEILWKTQLFTLEQRLPSSLNTFQKKMLDLSRAMATKPKVLLVDELAAGLNHEELNYVSEIMRGLLDTGISIVVVEHIMSFIKEISNRVIVMDAGKKIFEGGFKDATDDQYVREVYLGKRSSS